MKEKIGNLGEVAIGILNELHTERLDYESEYLPLVDCAQRCAAYEETGLLPEEVVKMGMMLEDSRRYSGRLELKLKPYLDIGLGPSELNALKLASVGKCVVEIKEFDGIAIDRLRKLAQADREGRCVVLPAKPDQTIYQWRIGDDCPSVSRLDGVQINADGEITYPIWNGYLIAEDFGRTVFLTREEAALRREQDG